MPIPTPSSAQNPFSTLAGNVNLLAMGQCEQRRQISSTQALGNVCTEWSPGAGITYKLFPQSRLISLALTSPPTHRFLSNSAPLELCGLQKVEGRKCPRGFQTAVISSEKVHFVFYPTEVA